MALMQLAYISRATFNQYARERGIEPTVARILATSRSNNPAKGIVGGLYYGDGCFFQYLEGEENAVRELCDRIRNDDRHTDFKVVLEGTIDQLSFGQWSMKYVPVTVGIDAFLYRHKLDRFDPYRFSPEIIDLIHIAQDADQPGSRNSTAKPSRQAGGLPSGLVLGIAGLMLATTLAVSIYVLA